MYRIIGFLGIILVAAPFFLGYSADSVARWTSVVIGGLVIISSYIEKLVKDKGRWEYKVAVASGFAIIAAPFLLLFENFSRSIWLSASVGILLILLGSMKLYMRGGIR